MGQPHIICPMDRYMRTIRNPRQAYSEEKDAAFYEAEIPAQELMLSDGYFAIYWPQDGHMPCLSAEGALMVKKVVVKIELL